MSITLPPGCAPGDLTALNQCFDDLANASELISKLMIDLINNDPAVAQAIIDAITKSGSALPLLGVTNGSDAVTPQVGEWFVSNTPVSLTGLPNSQLIQVGILPPGDWDVWASFYYPAGFSELAVILNPVPPGVTDNLATLVNNTGIVPASLATPATRALLAVDTLFVFQVQNTSPANAGSGTLAFRARRRR